MHATALTGQDQLATLRVCILVEHDDDDNVDVKRERVIECCLYLQRV